MNQRIQYRPSLLSWPDEGACVVRDREGNQLLILPISFLHQGHVDNARYVLRQLAFSYHDVATCQLLDDQGNILHDEEKIRRGEYWLARSGTRYGPVLPIYGPRFKFLARAPNTHDDFASTISDSKRSSANQSHFRTRVAMRDYSCLISGADLDNCTAAHILPVSRPEYYHEVLGYDIGFYFDVSFGILLRDDLHRDFDRGNIALWPLNDRYPTTFVVHMFHPSQAPYRAYHGQMIDASERFRGPDGTFPNLDMLRFHYQQCCQRNLRAYSHF